MIVPSNVTQVVNATIFAATIESSYDEADREKLAFTWNATEFNRHKLFIQLYFENPLEISKHVLRDQLKLEVIDPWPLISD